MCIKFWDFRYRVFYYPENNNETRQIYCLVSYIESIIESLL
jgi:hypothetical protein